MSDTAQLKRFPLFDSHFHIIDRRFPLTPNNGYLPDDLTCSDYLAGVTQYDLRGGRFIPPRRAMPARSRRRARGSRRNGGIANRPGWQ